MRAGLTIPLVSKAEIMDKLQAVQFDVRGTRAENRVLREKIPLKYKDCPWVVPNGSPYFAEGELVDLFNEAGGRLNLGTDYWFEGEFEPFCEATGRSICSFVKLSDKVLAENEFVSMTYQSIGAWFVPRNSIDEWVREIYIGKIPIPWSKVYNVPPTLPASKHSHSIKTEIGDWYELTFFFMYLANYYSTRDPAVYTEADRVINESFAKLKEVKAAQLARINNHDKDYGDPHQITKFHLQLGNHDNFDTATPAQDLAGTAANLLSTPEGVMQLADKYTVENDGIMRNGVLPVSYFGNGGYIPPTILGSFEGLGSLSECMGMCVEASGRLVVIQNHFDGRTEGLYFSVLSDYKNPLDPKNPYRFDYTAYRYEPPVLINNGIKPNHIVAGSGNDIIMVGKTDPLNFAGDRWFIALTNDSFDPSGHRYIEVNMKGIFNTFGNPDASGTWAGYLYHGRMMVYLLDQYAYLAVDSLMPNGQAGRMSYWRIPRQAMINGTPATWELVKLTYQDYDGVQYNNMNYWEFAQKVKSNGTVSRWGRYTFSPIQPPEYQGYFARRLFTLFAKKPGTTNTFYMNWLSYTFLEYAVPGKGQNNSASITNMVYEFNIETGVMTLLYKQPPITVDYQNDNTAAIYADRERWMQWYNALVRYTVAAVVITPNGERLASITGPAQEQTVLNSVIEYTQFEYVSNGQIVPSRAELLKGSVGKDRIRGHAAWERGRNLLTPIATGIGNRMLAYETAGENFMTYPTTYDPLKGSSLPKVVCRNITGDYAVRPEVTNRSKAPVYSRPLTNAVFDTNMTYADGVISITGTAAELAARGSEQGNMGLSYCGWSAGSDLLPGNLEMPSKGSTPFRAPNEAGAFISFPKTYQRVLDVGAQKVNYVPNDYYGVSVAARDKFRSLISAGQQGPWWAFELAMLNAEQGGMFGGLDCALLKLKYPTVAAGTTSTWDGQVFLIRPVVEAPNANHPGLYLITDFQVLGSTVKQVVHEYMYGVAGYQGVMVYYYNRPLLSIYRSGNVLQCAWYSGFTYTSGSNYEDQTLFTVNLGNNTFNGAVATYLPWNTGEYVVNIPKVGRSRVTLTNPDTYQGKPTDLAGPVETSDTSGGAARIYPVPRAGGGTDYYATVTSYPETGWAVFFLEEVAVMVQGTLYRAATGTVDLRDIDTDPRNKVFYVYITIEDTTAKYIFSTVKLRKGSAVMLVAVITTNEKQILTLERRTPFMVADYELSFIRDGGIIPISSGFPQDNGVFKFVKTSELLP